MPGFEVILVLVLVGVLLLKPQNMPEYIRKLMQIVRDLRRMFLNAQQGLERETGMSMEDLKKYDPRQYDPRKIVRDAWNAPLDDDDMKALEAGTKSTVDEVKDGVKAGVNEAKSTADTAVGTVSSAVSTVRDALLLKDVSDKPKVTEVEPVAAENAVAEPVAAELAVAEPVAAENAVAEPAAEPVVTVPEVTELAADTADTAGTAESETTAAPLAETPHPTTVTRPSPAALTPVTTTTEHVDAETGETFTREEVRSAYSVSHDHLAEHGAPTYIDAT